MSTQKSTTSINHGPTTMFPIINTSESSPESSARKDIPTNHTKSNTLYSNCDQQCPATTTPFTPLSSPPRSHPTHLSPEPSHRHPPNSIPPAAAVSPKMSARPQTDQFVVRLGSTISGRQAREYLWQTSVRDRRMPLDRWLPVRMTKCWRARESRRCICGSW